MSGARVTTAPSPDNQQFDASLRARIQGAEVVWRQRRLVLIAGVVAVFGSHLAGNPIIAWVGMIAVAAAVFLSELEVVLARRATTARQFDRITLASRVGLVTVLAMALELGGAGSGVTLGVIAGFIVSVAGSISTKQIYIVVGYTSALFMLAETGVAQDALPHAHVIGPEQHFSAVQTVVLGLLGIPGVAAMVHLRWRHANETRQQLEFTVDELSLAHTALEQSREELERLNAHLNVEVAMQTAELELRNRYLSVVNAVSTALSEPGNHEPVVGRAVRIAGRLLGARAAQGWQTASVTEPRMTFIRLEEVARDATVEALPRKLLEQVAAQREPLFRSDAVAPDGQPLPEVGGNFAVIPIRSHGESLGAFAFIGLDERDLGSRERNLLLSVGREVGAALMNAAHLRQTEARADHVALLNNAARLSTRRTDTAGAISEVLDLVRAHIDALRVSVLTAPGEGEEELLAFAGESGEYSLDGRFNARLPALVADGTSVTYRRADGTLPPEVAERVGTLILVPVRANGPGVLSFAPPTQPEADDDDAQPADRVVGVLVASSAVDGAWGPEIVELLDEVAEIIARRLESDAYDLLQRRRVGELASLAEVARLMQSGADIERLCGGFARAVSDVMAHRSMTIVHAAAPPARPDVYSYASEGRVASIAPPDEEQLARLAGIVEIELWSSEDEAPVEGLLADGGLNGIAIPLLSKGQPLGAVLIATDGRIPGDRLSIVTQAVEQLALALDAAALYQQATSRASQIQTQSNLARIVASQPDLRRAFDAFAEEMRWLVPFDRAVLYLGERAGDSLLPYASSPHGQLPDLGDAPVGEAVVALCAERTQPFRLRRTDADLSAGEWTSLAGDAEEATIVPVYHRHELVAIFALLSGNLRDRVSVDIGVLSEVASLLAVTIERVRLFEQSEHMARHDPMTGLPNFRYVQEHLQQVGARANGSRVSVLMVDMDNLKPFNDLLGHEVGDHVIQIMARELVARSRGDDFVGRIGGDEFVLVMEHVGAEGAAAAASRIHRALADAHLEIPGAPEPIAVSIGVACYPDDADSIDALLREADRAMYAAKALGGARSALARDRADRGRHPLSVGREGRLLDVLLRSATSDATEAQRTAIALADRYAALTAAALGFDSSLLPAIRALVIAASIQRFDSASSRAEVAVTRGLLGDVEASALVGEALADQAQAVAQGAVDLAWRQTPGACATPVSVEEAVRAVDALLSSPNARSASAALASIARSDAAERRSDRVA